MKKASRIKTYINSIIFQNSAANLLKLDKQKKIKTLDYIYRDLYLIEEKQTARGKDEKGDEGSIERGGRWGGLRRRTGHGRGRVDSREGWAELGEERGRGRQHHYFELHTALAHFGVATDKVVESDVV